MLFSQEYVGGATKIARQMARTTPGSIKSITVYHSRYTGGLVANPQDIPADWVVPIPTIGNELIPLVVFDVPRGTVTWSTGTVPAERVDVLIDPYDLACQRVAVASYVDPVNWWAVVRSPDGSVKTHAWSGPFVFEGIGRGVYQDPSATIYRAGVSVRTPSGTGVPA